VLPGVLGDIPYHADLTLDAYAPRGEPRPAAVVVHGRGSKVTHMIQVLEPLARAGYAWFTVSHRSLEDLRRGLAYIRCPGRFNITSRVILIGEDTGAHAALQLAAAGGFAGVATFGAKLTSPEPAPTAPVVMFHGTADTESPIAAVRDFCAKLKDCRVSPVDDGIHAMENWRPAQWDWKEEFAAWLRDDRRGLWKEIVYARPDGRDLLLDAHLPQGRGPFPAVIIAHGGGWEAGDKLTYVTPLFEPLAKAGFAWFSIDYRLTPFVRNAEQLEDVRAAIRHVRRYAARYHVDPNRIAILGESASGQMVTQVVSEPCSGCEVQAVVSFYGVYDFTPRMEDRKAQLDRLFGPWTPEVVRRYSPLFNARAQMPPVLLIQGSGERLYEGTLAYAKRLRELGVRHDLVILEGAPHGMENWESRPEWAHYKQKLADWLRATLR